jgi:hypothetical protein
MDLHPPAQLSGKSLQVRRAKWLNPPSRVVDHLAHHARCLVVDHALQLAWPHLADGLEN